MNAASARARLLNAAKVRDEAYDLVLVRYAIEGVLRRLALSPHRDALVLKGGSLFLAWGEPHRATRDLDLLAEAGDLGLAAETLREVLALPGVDDALEFDLGSLVEEPIRARTEGGGLHLALDARLGSAVIPVRIDLASGDAVVPVEERYPTLLGAESPLVRAYPRASVVAEKLEAVVALGEANTRLKDLFDLWFLLTTYGDSPETLAPAVAATFVRRGTEIPRGVPVGLSEPFATDPDRARSWTRFVGRSVGVAPTFVEVIAVVREGAAAIFAAVEAS